MEQNNYTFRKLDESAKRIGRIYRTYHLKDYLQESRPDFYGELKDQEEEKPPLGEPIDKVIDHIIAQLPEQYQMIIRNDYFSNMTKHWWMGYYSRATYYRLKKQGLILFLSYLS